MYKAAIIGTGKIAMTGHVPAFIGNNLKDKILISSFAEVSEERQKKFKEIFPGSKAYISIEELLEKDQPDFIDICVPPDRHYEIIEKAVRYKTGIICEKPFTKTADEALALEEKIKVANIPFICCHQYKYSPIWKHFKTFTSERNYMKNIFSQFNVFRLSADTGFDNSEPKWRTNPDISGGGILSDTGVHYLYLTRWLFGNPLEINVHNFKIKHKDYNVEDTSLAVLKFNNGVAEINLTWAADKRHNSAFLTNGESSLHYINDTLILSDDNGTKSLPVPDASDKRTYISFYESIFLDFINNFNNRKFTEDNLSEAKDIIKILELCYKSANKNNSVRF